MSKKNLCSLIVYKPKNKILFSQVCRTIQSNVMFCFPLIVDDCLKTRFHWFIWIFTKLSRKATEYAYPLIYVYVVKKVVKQNLSFS